VPITGIDAGRPSLDPVHEARNLPGSANDLAESPLCRLLGAPSGAGAVDAGAAAGAGAGAAGAGSPGKNVIG
jgi:hypothetical protein